MWIFCYGYFNICWILNHWQNIKLLIDNNWPLSIETRALYANQKLLDVSLVKISSLGNCIPTNDICKSNKHTRISYNIEQDIVLLFANFCNISSINLTNVWVIHVIHHCSI